MSDLLLHVCCAPCASACVERLKKEGRSVLLYYSNSNINTAEEFEKRLTYVRRLAEIYSLEVIADPYDHAAWLKHVSQVPDFAQCRERGARCTACFSYSLGRAAQEALKRNMTFATTLTVSPHKNSGVIFKVGGCYEHFEKLDFKKKDGFKRSLELSREYGFYRQNYCGCEFSCSVC